MAKTEEGKIQDATINYGNRLGVRTIRLYFGPGIQTGWPDVLFLIPGGRPLFIEFKKPGAEPTAKQRIKIAILEEAGYDVAVCSSRDEGERLILKYLRDANRAAKRKAK